jgi:hypothetical protein
MLEQNDERFFQRQMKMRFLQNFSSLKRVFIQANGDTAVRRSKKSGG